MKEFMHFSEVWNFKIPSLFSKLYVGGSQKLFHVNSSVFPSKQRNDDLHPLNTHCVMSFFGGDLIIHNVSAQPLTLRYGTITLDVCLKRFWRFCRFHFKRNSEILILGSVIPKQQLVTASQGVFLQFPGGTWKSLN